MAGTVLLTWFVWRGTWFGVRLSDDELIAAMAPDAKPRDVQHGIEEITHRLDAQGPNVDRWAGLLIAASRRPEQPVRNSAAWGLGYGGGRADFVARLRELVAEDPSILVRRNAALSLTRNADASGLSVLRSMIEPFVVRAPDAGTVATLAAVGQALRADAPAARLTTPASADVDVRAPVPGRVLEQRTSVGARVEADVPLLVLAADPEHQLNAVAALGLVGTKDDLETLSVLAGPHTDAREDVKAAARRSVEAIRARSK